ncbi:type IV secretory system conjugative DNA transfer family protein [Thermincola ferriacetica]
MLGNTGTQYNSDTDKLVMGLLMLAACVLLLPSVPFFLAAVAAISYFRLENGKGAAILLCLGVVVSALVYFFAGPEMVKTLAEAGKSVYLGFKEQDISLVRWGPLLAYGLPVGIFEALIYLLFKIFKPGLAKEDLPVVDQEVRTISPRRLQSRLKNIQKAGHPANGTVLGVDINTGGNVVLTDEELNGHALLLGATGSGKTTTILNFLQSCCQRDIPIILIDGKGDPGLAAASQRLAEQAGKRFYLFSTVKPKQSCRYNPLKHGGPTELKDKLISTSDWSEEHYKKQAERFLQSVFHLFEKTGERVDLVNVVEKLGSDQLGLLIRRLPREEAAQFSNLVDVEGIGGLINRLAVFAESEIAGLFVDDGNALDLVKAVDESAVVFFSLDSLRFPEYARLLGRLIVLDIKTVVSRMFGRNKKIYAVFDEFGVFASGQVVDFVNKSRGAGFHSILSIQDLADLRAGGGETLMNQIVANTNVKIIQRQDVPESAEFLASLIGTRESTVFTHQVDEHGLTGIGTVKKERSFLVHPDEIKQLSRGEAVILKKFPKHEVVRAVIRNPAF